MKKSFPFSGLKILLAVISSATVFCLLNAFGKLPKHQHKFADSTPIIVPIAGNTWSSPKENEGGRVTNNGIQNWTNSETFFTTYVRVNKTGNLKISINLKVPDGNSVLEISIKGHSEKINAEGNEYKDYDAGEWQISDTGYIAIILKGISKTGNEFAEISNYKLEGTVIDGQTSYTKNNEGNFFLWGRRGPSVHLNYIVPKDEDVEWFYNEVTVPKGEDVLGSYFMADGFGEGYFGMQVNSPTERHILFSVWSPFKTDNPKDIPDSQKIQLVKKGEGVHAGEFGNEGSGGQSYMNYNWKAGNTYKFLLHGKPDGTNHTVYTAYFFTPEDGNWHLVASFRRPATDTWLKHLYSFLENFSPSQGDLERKVLFGNQWICTNEGKWIELNKILFTADNTARKGYRMDYAGGVKGDEFYLQNCGFFNDYTPIDTFFERPLTNKNPDIDLDKLP